MQKFKYILILILTFIFGGCFKKSDIQEIDSFKEAQTTLDKADKNTLVIFDIDRTLTVPANVFLQHWFFDTDIGKQFVHETNEHIDSQENPKEYGKLIRSKRKLAFTDQPIESITVDLVKQLQNRGIKVIALTYYKTGGMGLISSLPQWRYEKLKEIGIDFSRNLAPQNVSLPQFTSKKGRHPVFYKGILLTELFAKGDVLGTFLDTLNWKPHDTIFFDDTLEHLKSVKKEMKKRNIPFQG
ncbi:MAG: hypothetical protein US32_C0011G0025 [candidate division TM6 bacterium GW2011_GWA2_36_9]|nr:MAG: hypothetical protein US32_C0011G0025 [candidate division TM6 bacterium GW2011_GWA2_36_9]